MSAQQQDLNPTMQELVTRMARMQAELDELKGHTYARTHALPQQTSPAKPQVSTTRRRMLRRLAGGLIAGLAVGGIGAGLPQTAEAKMVANPVGPGLTGRVGMVVMPPGSAVSGTLIGGSTKVGLLVGGDIPFDVSKFTPTVNAAILAFTSGGGSAIVGQTQTGTGVYGQSDNNFGMAGQSTSGIGINGVSSSNYGVQGTSATNHGIYGSTGAKNFDAIYAGVYGIATSTDQNSSSAGVYGSSLGGLGIGVYGKAALVGVWGETTVTGGNAGFFNGDVDVFGKLTKSSGDFKIDHPLDPANKYLYHSFVESPDMKNIYDGVVTLDEKGEVIIEMPDWFEALNSDFRYQLTSMGTSMPDLFIAEEIKERKFKIAGGKGGERVSWMVTGIRQDAYAKAHRSPVEEEKTGDNKGKFIHPELFGQPEEMAINRRPPFIK